MTRRGQDLARGPEFVVHCYSEFTADSWLSFVVQVYSVVDEMFLAGEIRETSQTKVLKQLLMLSSLE